MTDLTVRADATDGSLPRAEVRIGEPDDTGRREGQIVCPPEWRESIAPEWAVQDMVLRHLGDLRPVPVADEGGLQDNADRTREGVGLLAAIGPTSGLETMLAEQMLASHELAMKLSSRAMGADDVRRLETFTRLANQTQRTFAAQVEALSRLRNGGKQTHEVRYVDARTQIDARTQTVLAGGGGGGMSKFIGQQGHAPAIGAVAGVAAMPCPDAFGGAVSVACDQEQEAMSDARREESRSAARPRQRELSTRRKDPRREGGSSKPATVGR